MGLSGPHPSQAKAARLQEQTCGFRQQQQSQPQQVGPSDAAVQRQPAAKEAWSTAPAALQQFPAGCHHRDGEFSWHGGHGFNRSTSRSSSCSDFQGGLARNGGRRNRGCAQHPGCGRAAGGDASRLCIVHTAAAADAGRQQTMDCGWHCSCLQVQGGALRRKSSISTGACRTEFECAPC